MYKYTYCAMVGGAVVILLASFPHTLLKPSGYDRRRKQS